MNAYYCLNKNIQVKKDGGAGLLMLKDQNDNYSFFYVKKGFNLFLSLNHPGSYLYLDLSSLDSSVGIKMFNCISSLVTSNIFTYVSSSRISKLNNKKIFTLKTIPQLESLFITPTNNFSRYYD